MTIIEFLTARYDEDEAAARTCLGVNALADMRRGIDPPRWTRDGGSIRDDRPDGSGHPVLRVQHTWAREAEHITRHDPARTLADIAAKRRILEEHAPGRDRCDEHDASFRTIPCPTILALASVYADHPDHRQEWRP